MKTKERAETNRRKELMLRIEAEAKKKQPPTETEQLKMAKDGATLSHAQVRRWRAAGRRAHRRPRAMSLAASRGRPASDRENSTEFGPPPAPGLTFPSSPPIFPPHLVPAYRCCWRRRWTQ